MSVSPVFTIELASRDDVTFHLTLEGPLPEEHLKMPFGTHRIQNVLHSFRDGIT